MLEDHLQTNLGSAGNPALERGRAYLTRFAVISLWTAICAGCVGSLLFTPVYPMFRVWGLSLTSLRPLHLIAGTGWIYLGGLAAVAHHWSRAERSRHPVAASVIRFFLWTWGLGAAVFLIATLTGSYGGREYFFTSIPSSILFWSGWVALTWAYVRSQPRASGTQPVYIWMWMTSFGLFTYAFVETHVFLLPYFQQHPLRDMAVEWKSYGTLVGSFNLLVYGALAYLADSLNPQGRYSRSTLAFSLFFVGVFNSFTNYGHHTYHLPQSLVVKWTSFTISMTEIVILAKVVADTLAIARRRRGPAAADGVTMLLAATRWWTLASLVLAIVISVPPWNALIHGTLVVAGHAMGSMLGIDTMGLLAVLAWFHLDDRRGAAKLPRWPIVTLNLGIAAIWASFLIVGLQDSFRRWEFGVLPSRSVWPGWFGPTFATSGLVISVSIIALTWPWLLPRRLWLAATLPSTPEALPGEDVQSPSPHELRRRREGEHRHHHSDGRDRHAVEPSRSK